MSKTRFTKEECVELAGAYIRHKGNATAAGREVNRHHSAIIRAAKLMGIYKRKHRTKAEMAAARAKADSDPILTNPPTAEIPSRQVLPGSTLFDNELEDQVLPAATPESKSPFDSLRSQVNLLFSKADALAKRLDESDAKIEHLAKIICEHGIRLDSVIEDHVRVAVSFEEHERDEELAELFSPTYEAYAYAHH